MDRTVQFISHTYDQLGYFDLYGNSVLLCLLLTLVVTAVFVYCQVMQSKQAIADDWANQRCKPQHMLFAGFISKPDNASVWQATRDNFQYCVQTILANQSAFALQPFQFLISSLAQVYSSMASSVQEARKTMDTLRSGVADFSEDVFGRILNVTIPLQQMFISLLDVFQKIQGTMTASLYTMLGSYYVLQSLMGAILELIVKMLVSLVIIIVGLWVLPFTWPAAASMTAVFTAIAIPLSIMVVFMSEVLHIKSSAIPKLRCFDEHTWIPLSNARLLPICRVRPGDVLRDGSIVTATFCVTACDMPMYWLNRVLVSGSHLVIHGTQWVRVEDHPEAVRYEEEYGAPCLYCLNTSNKRLCLNGTTFSDWDELLDGGHPRKDLVGWDPSTPIALSGNRVVPLDRVSIWNVLCDGGVVYGTVQMEGGKRHLLTSNGNLFVHGKNVKDFNACMDELLLLNQGE